MRAVLVSAGPDCAEVELHPGWLARLLGARRTVTRAVKVTSPGGACVDWKHADTGRDITRGPYGDIILNAIDFRDADRPALPAARLLARCGVGG